MEKQRKRISVIIEALNQQRFTNPLEVTDIEYKDTTYGSYEEVNSEEGWLPFQGLLWGGPDKHVCFRTRICLEEQHEGRQVVLSLCTGADDQWNTDNPQFLIYLDGKAACGMDMNHTQVFVSRKGTSGEVHDIGIYAYSNSRRPDVFLDLALWIYHPLVEALYYDLKVPFETASLLPDDDLVAVKTMDLLNQAVNQLDFRQPGSDFFYKSVEAVSAWFKEFYYEGFCQEQDIRVHSVGSTHIDIAWKWPVRQTREKAVRSFSTVNYLMDQYPEYKFMSSQPVLYEFVKEENSELYGNIKRLVAEGRWEPEGGMWLEPDCNLTSGESLVRQLLYGKQFFQAEFGVDNEVLWLPDVFGYSAAMPQILKKSGIRYFMTTKIGWNDTNQIPNDTMIWQGIDGSEILTYFITTRNYFKDQQFMKQVPFNTTYNGLQNPSHMMGTWQRYQNKNINQDLLTCYGYGDGGGGPTREILEESRRLEKGIPGCPQVKQTFVKDYFRLLEKSLAGKRIPKWCGELYLEYHRGTLTSMGEVKRNNRKGEFKNLDTEWLLVLAKVLSGVDEYDREKLDQAWKLLMLNQFHDILPGSSIKEVYEDAKKDYQEIAEITDGLIEAAMKVILNPDKTTIETAAGKGMVVFNPLGFARQAVFTVPGGIEAEMLQYLPGQYQKTGSGEYVGFVDMVPSKGYLTLEKEFEIRKEKKSPFTYIQKESIETPYYLIEFDAFGRICCLYDKDAGRNVEAPGCTLNHLRVFEDRPKDFDSWNIEAYYEECSWEVSQLTTWDMKESGPVRLVIAFEWKFLNSVIQQNMILYSHTRRIDFETHVDWQEQQLLLKAEFPLYLQVPKATYDIQFGNVERPNHKNTSWDQARFEVCAHKWADLSEAGYGVALLNDCKYGYDIQESRIRLTLLKSGIFPNPDADKGEHDFTYSLFPHSGDFRTGKVIQEAYVLNCPCYVKMLKGRRMKEKRVSLVHMDVDNVFLEVVKLAEDNDDIILRMHEAYGMRQRFRLTLPAAVEAAWECDLMENRESICQVDGTGIMLEICPYEIKTIRLSISIYRWSSPEYSE